MKRKYLVPRSERFEMQTESHILSASGKETNIHNNQTINPEESLSKKRSLWE